MAKNLILGPILPHLAQIWVLNFFLQILSLLADRHYSKLSSYVISTYSGWAFFGMFPDGGDLFGPHLPKICHTYPTMIKPGTAIPYPKKIQKIYKSCDTSLEFCCHQHFFTGIRKFCYIKKYRCRLGFDA